METLIEIDRSFLTWCFESFEYNPHNTLSLNKYFLI